MENPEIPQKEENPTRPKVESILKNPLLTSEQLKAEQAEWKAILEPYNCREIHCSQDPKPREVQAQGIFTISFKDRDLKIIQIIDAIRDTGKNSHMYIEISKTPNGYFVKTICHDGASGQGSRPFKEMTKEEAIEELKKEIKEWDERPMRLDEMPI